MDKSKFMKMFEEREDPVTFVEVRKAIDKESQRLIRKIKLDAAALKKSIASIAENNPFRPEELKAVNTLIDRIPDMKMDLTDDLQAEVEAMEESIAVKLEK